MASSGPSQEYDLNNVLKPLAQPCNEHLFRLCDSSTSRPTPSDETYPWQYCDSVTVSTSSTLGTSREINHDNQMYPCDSGMIGVPVVSNPMTPNQQNGVSVVSNPALPNQQNDVPVVSNPTTSNQQNGVPVISNQQDDVPGLRIQKGVRLVLGFARKK